MHLQILWITHFTENLPENVDSVWKKCWIISDQSRRMRIKCHSNKQFPLSCQLIGRFLFGPFHFPGYNSSISKVWDLHLRRRMEFYFSISDHFFIIVERKKINSYASIEISVWKSVLLTFVELFHAIICWSVSDTKNIILREQGAGKPPFWIVEEHPLHLFA